MTELIELAERCAKATGPDRELDKAIALGIGYLKEPNDFVAPLISVPPIPAYTAAFEAAITLVPARLRLTLSGPGRFGWHARLLTLEQLIDDDGEATAYAFVATPALALCAAALRARVSQANRQEAV